MSQDGQPRPDRPAAPEPVRGARPAVPDPLQGARPEPINPSQARKVAEGIIAEDQTRLAKPKLAPNPRAAIRPDEARDLAAGISSADQTRLAHPARRGAAADPATLHPTAQDATAMQSSPQQPSASDPAALDPATQQPRRAAASRLGYDAAEQQATTLPPAAAVSQPGSGLRSRMGSSLGGSGTGRVPARYARPVDRYEVPVEPITVQKRGPSMKTLIIALIGLVIFGILIGLIYVRFIRDTEAENDTIVQPSQSTDGMPRITEPEEVVRRYLNALAKGDVSTAISLGNRSPGDTSAISPEAYRASLATHPITDISVPRQDNVSSYVSASYKIGDEAVDTRFRVVRDDAGGWRLAHSTIEFRFNYRNSDQLPVRLNGVQLIGTSASLLPGAYTIDAGQRYIDFGRNAKVVISNLEYEGTVQRALTPTLTEEGSRALLEAGRTSLNQCLRISSLSPDGCPNRMTAAADYDQSSVQWSLLNDPFLDAAPALDLNRQTWGQATLVLRLEVTFRYSDGTTSGNQRPAPITAHFAADMLTISSEQLQVTWTT